MAKVKIVTDTASGISVEEGHLKGIHVVPLNVVVDGKSYKDTVEITGKEVYKAAEAGALVGSSLPGMQDVIDIYDDSDDFQEILNITVADGLSGTYNGAVLAKSMSKYDEKITVLNSSTIACAQRYMVEKAKNLADMGKNCKEIITAILESRKETRTFVIPQETKYLRRSGRITKTASAMLMLLKIKPILTMTEDGRRGDKFGFARTFTGALDKIIDLFIEKGVSIKHVIYVSHANAIELVKGVLVRISERLPGVETIVHELAPTLGAQGGPGSVVIEYILK